MQFKYIMVILMAAILSVFTACKHDHPHNPDGSHMHEGEHLHAPDGSHIDASHPELEALSFTERTSLLELFVEFTPLIVGTESRFAAHFSNMQTFKAIEEGEAKVRLIQNGKTILENSVNGPSSPGIFRPSIRPKKAGVYDLEFALESSRFSDKITLSGIEVYPSEAEAIADTPHSDEGDEISYLKEQAWKTEFAIAEMRRHNINEVIKTSGEIQAVKGKEKIVSANSAGIIFYKNSGLREGREVRKGEVLFTISSKGLMKSNLEEKYQIAKARQETAKANFERAEDLLAQQIIGQKEYENRKMEYAVAEAEWQTLSNSNQGNGQVVKAPMSGIIKNLMVSDGEFAREGTALLEITNTRRLILSADIAQDYHPMLSQIVSANFRTPYQKEVQSLEDYNGKLVSVGKVLEEDQHFLSVLFELDNVNNLVPGSFVELFLLTKPVENQLLVPKSALMQDYNVNYVYVQTAGESFQKREVQLGINDGKNVQILSGVSEGEWVVTKGAYQIKMASMSSTIPAHGHAH